MADRLFGHCQKAGGHQKADQRGFPQSVTIRRARIVRNYTQR
jgi:hypothetical protein